LSKPKPTDHSHARLNAANLRPPSFVKVKLTSGAFVFVSRPTLAPPAAKIAAPPLPICESPDYHSSLFLARSADAIELQQHRIRRQKIPFGCCVIASCSLV